MRLRTSRLDVRTCAMLEHIKFKSSNGSGSLAAAYLIFAVGLVGVTLCSALSFRQHPGAPMLVLAIGGCVGLATIFARMRPELPSRRLWLFTRGQRHAVYEYTPRLMKSPRATSFGTNHPPTVEEIRELKESPRTWVPSRSRNGRTSLRQG